MSESRVEMIQWIKQLHKEGYLKENQYCLSVRQGNRLLITPEGLNIQELTPANLIDADFGQIEANQVNLLPEEANLHADIYKKHEQFNAIIHSYGDSTLTLSRAGKTVKPVFDDFAQLIGINCKVVQPSLDSVSKALKFRNAVYLKDRGALCASCDLDDAYAVAMVLDKNSKAVIETLILGGGKIINVIESALMRFVYKLKYSKAATKNR